MIRKLQITIALLLMSYISQAQFGSSGHIEYVRTTNMHLSMKLEFGDQFQDKSMMDQMLKMFPKNATKHYVMSFDEEKSYFRYEKDGPEKMPSFGGKDPASENIVIKNFKNNTYEAQKEFLDNYFLVKDSIPQYQWKIHDEVRQIAGYNCRKATTVIYDSVYVVAFYADEITVSGGPESFGGLPGMILGLAVPRLYSSWFATKVEFKAYDPTIEKNFNRKAKTTSIESLNKELLDKLSDYGAFGTQVLFKVGI